MKINSLHPHGFLGAPSKVIPFKSDLVCIASSSNGMGKTSLLEAIRFGLTGRPGRGITAKGDYKMMVAEGSAKGTVSITVDDGEVMRRDVTSGKLLSGEELSDEVLAILPSVLDAQQFMRLSSKEQRAFVFKLLKIKFDWPAVKAELEAETIPPNYIEEVSAIIRNGFEAACATANTRASEARGAWKQITGEVHGSAKGASWSAAYEAREADDGEEVDVEALTEAREAIAQQIEAKRTELSDARSAHRAFIQHEGQLADAPTAKQLDKKVKDALAAIATAEKALPDLKAAAEVRSGTTGPCPKCKTLLTYDAGEFHISDGAAPAGPAEVEAYRKAQAELAGLRQAHGAAVIQQTRYATLREQSPEQVTEETVTRIEGELFQLGKDAQAIIDQLASAGASDAARLEAEAKTNNAMERHNDVMNWVKVETALKPDGIPSKLLQKGLHPLNKMLADIGREIGWTPARIGTDFEVRVGDRVYQLLSESEQWRVDAMIAAAIAIVSGIKLLLLDRVDVLAVPARAEILGWLGTCGLFDTVVAAATMKKKPVALTDRFGAQVIWLEEPNPSGPDATERSVVTDE